MSLPVGDGRALLPPTEPVRTGPIHGDPLFPPPDLTRRLPYVALNMVATIDGRAAVNGTAIGLGSPTDYRLLRRLRGEADAVLHGAGTVRAHRLTPRVDDDARAARVARGQSTQPAGVVVSGSGRLSAEHPYFTSATVEWPRLVYTAEPTARSLGSRPGVEVIVQPGPPLDLTALLEDLAQRGLRRIVCEGGPNLNRPLLAAGLVDELFVTLAPRLDAGLDPLTLLTGERLPAIRLELRSVFERESELFLRYKVGAPTIGAMT
jgi:riboflavin-specific deaminase-like protein